MSPGKVSGGFRETERERERKRDRERETERERERERESEGGWRRGRRGGGKEGRCQCKNSVEHACSKSRHPIKFPECRTSREKRGQLDGCPSSGRCLKLQRRSIKPIARNWYFNRTSSDTNVGRSRVFGASGRFGYWFSANSKVNYGLWLALWDGANVKSPEIRFHRD